MWERYVQDALTLTTQTQKTVPAPRPGISAPARPLQTSIVHGAQEPDAAQQVLTIRAAVGEFAHSVTTCINNRAGLFSVITTSLEMAACPGLNSDILCVQTQLLQMKFPQFRPDYVMPYI